MRESKEVDGLELAKTVDSLRERTGVYLSKSVISVEPRWLSSPMRSFELSAELMSAEDEDNTRDGTSTDSDSSPSSE